MWSSFISNVLPSVPREGSLSLELVIRDEMLDDLQIPHYYAIISFKNGDSGEYLLFINRECLFVDKDTAFEGAHTHPFRGLQRHSAEILLGTPLAAIGDPHWNHLMNYFAKTEYNINNLYPRDAAEIYAKLIALCNALKDRLLMIGNNVFYVEKINSLKNWFSEYYYFEFRCK